mmetsp:Transcript_28593/g.51993  ORF Transcript_28593/g.51993 Transcript_28593/m.51993 type:complete len:286 (-) Transcript_28593:114-971(-)
MLSSHLQNLLQCCRGSACDNHGSQSELQIQLSSDLADMQNPRHQITQADSFDITFTPRSFSNYSSRSTPQPLRSMTPRQRDLRDHLELPLLHTYPLPPICSPDEPEEEKKKKLLEMYQEFALDLHTGMYLTQLTSSRDYSDIHCQLMEDLQTLKLDQSNGRIVEFPLTGVSKVYRIVKNDEKWYSAASATAGVNMEHIVVVEFMRRKLAFVFKELQVAQRFLLCMELLIRRAQQKQAQKALRSLTPTFPPATGQSGRSGDDCATPRQVREAQACGAGAGGASRDR